MCGAQKSLESDKVLKSRGRGNYEWRVDANSNTMVIKWNDNNIVSLALNFVGNEEGESLKRWVAKDHRYIQIKCPKMEIYITNLWNV